MSKERFNQIIDEVFINYCQTKIEKTSTGEIWISYAGHYGIISKEEFINKCKTDNEFSEKWGLTIEERVLTPKERIELADGKIQDKYPALVEMSLRVCDERDIPTKLITLTYNNETVITYE
jgi:hypothetical protein